MIFTTNRLKRHDNDHGAAGLAGSSDPAPAHDRDAPWAADSVLAYLDALLRNARPTRHGIRASNESLGRSAESVKPTPRKIWARRAGRN